MRKYTILLPILVCAVLFLAACTAVIRTPADDGEGAQGKADLPTSEQASAAPVPDELSTLADEDFALFVTATQASDKTFSDRLAVCPEVVLPGGRQFPLAEPDYNAKRPLDLTAFAAALDGWTPEQAAAADELLAGKSIPAIQAADGCGAALRRRPGDVLRRSHQALRRR